MTRVIFAGGVLACLLLAGCQKQPETADQKAAPVEPAVESTTPPPATKPVPGEKVTFSGCPSKGVEASCMMVVDGGVTYDVTSAQPPIEIKGLGVSGEGVVSDGVGICMQGVMLKDIKYSYNKMKCPTDGEAAPTAE